MESLAYLHLASSTEVFSRVGSSQNGSIAGLVNRLDRHHLSAQFLFRLLAAFIGLTITTLASYVLAFPLELGSTEPEVEAVQRCLVDQNYLYTDEFGYFGPKTQEAVIRFQEDRGLYVDGIVGEATLSALNCNLARAYVPEAAYDYAPPAYVPPPAYYGNSSPVLYAQAGSQPVLREGSTDPAVQDLQRRLQRAGYNPGPIDGAFGGQTKQAVVRFQQANNLQVDGIVGPSTWNALNGRSPIGSGGSRPTPEEQFGIAALQERLRDRGFYNGPIDGQIGPSTQRAIADAQRSYGLSNSEIIRGAF